MRFKLIFLFFAMLSSVVYGQVLDDELKAEFIAGRVRLKNSIFNSAYTGREKTISLLNEGRWEELVENVLGKKWNGNIYYFLLGRAAEGMGAKAAAIKYYEHSLNDKMYDANCAKYIFGDACMGFKLPQQALDRKTNLVSAIQGAFVKWGAEDGPLLSDYIKISPVTVEELRKIDSNKSMTKGKFESDEEFLLRKMNSHAGSFVIFPISTDDESRCQTDFDHKSSIFGIRRCVIVSGETPVLRKRELGEPIFLANMVDRREIKRFINSSYYIDFDFVLNTEFSVSREEAVVLDKDLVAGVVVGGFSRVSSCLECDERRSSESLAGLMDSIGALNNRKVDTTDIDWKKEAFRTGSIEESWTYKFMPSKVQKIVIFRKSNSRLLYEYIPD